MLPVRIMGEGALHIPRGKARGCCHKMLGLGWEPQPEDLVAWPRAAGSLFSLSKLALLGLGLGLTPLQILTKQQAGLLSSLSNAVCLALVPSQPTFATTTLSPQSRNSWGEGPEIWLRLLLYGLDSQSALGSSCSLVLGQAQKGSPAFQRDKMLLTS